MGLIEVRAKKRLEFFYNQHSILDQSQLIVMDLNPNNNKSINRVLLRSSDENDLLKWPNSARMDGYQEENAHHV